jgi:hypothetical protein
LAIFFASRLAMPFRVGGASAYRLSVFGRGYRGLARLSGQLRLAMGHSENEESKFEFRSLHRGDPRLCRRSLFGQGVAGRHGSCGLPRKRSERWRGGSNREQ